MGVPPGPVLRVLADGPATFRLESVDLFPDPLSDLVPPFRGHRQERYVPRLNPESDGLAMYSVDEPGCPRALRRQGILDSTGTVGHNSVKRPRGDAGRFIGACGPRAERHERGQSQRGSSNTAKRVGPAPSVGYLTCCRCCLRHSTPVQQDPAPDRSLLPVGHDLDQMPTRVE